MSSAGTKTFHTLLLFVFPGTYTTSKSDESHHYCAPFAAPFALTLAWKNQLRTHSKLTSSCLTTLHFAASTTPGCSCDPALTLFQRGCLTRPAGKGRHPPAGSSSSSSSSIIGSYPSVGRFENEPATTTLYTKGSSAKFTDNDGRKSIAPYSNYGQLSHELSHQQQQQQQQHQQHHHNQQQQQQSSPGIVGLRTASYTVSNPASSVNPNHHFRDGDVDDIFRPPPG